MQIQSASKEAQHRDLHPPIARFVTAGTPFSHRNPITGKPYGPLLMRVKATGFILNSSLLGDVINRGDVLCVNLEKGTVFAMQGDREVVIRECTLVTEDE